MSIFGEVVSSSSDENRVRQARNAPAGFFYIREKRRIYDGRRVFVRLRVLQSGLPSGDAAAMGVCVLAHRRQEWQIEANACVLEAFCWLGVVECAPLLLTHAGVFFSRARVLTLLYGE